MKSGLIIGTALGVTALGFGGVYVYKQLQSKKQETPPNSNSSTTQNTIAIVKPKYKKGDALYAIGQIDVKEAVKKNNTWSGTNNPYGVFAQGKKVGVIEEAGIVPDLDQFGKPDVNAGQPFYIVRKCTIESFSIFGFNTSAGFYDYGVVIESQGKLNNTVFRLFGYCRTVIESFDFFKIYNMCSCTSENKTVIKKPLSMMFLDPGTVITSNKKGENYSFPQGLETPPLTIKGYVTDDFGKPLSEAHVYVSKDLGTYTDDNGFFVLDDVPQDELLTISHQGYGTLLQEPSENMGMITLESEAMLMDAVIVNADPKPAKEEKESFPWDKILIGVATTVVSGLIIRAVTRPKTFKGTV